MLAKCFSKNASGLSFACGIFLDSGVVGLEEVKSNGTCSSLVDE